MKGARKIKNDAQKELDVAAKAIKRKSIKQKVKLPPQAVENGGDTALPKRQSSIEQTRKYEMQLKRNSAAAANTITIYNKQCARLSLSLFLKYFYKFYRLSMHLFIFSLTSSKCSPSSCTGRRTTSRTLPIPNTTH